MKYIHIHPLDNVAVALEDLKKGDLISVTAKAPAEIQSTEAPAGLPSAQAPAGIQHGCREIAIFKDGVTL